MIAYGDYELMPITILRRTTWVVNWLEPGNHRRCSHAARGGPRPWQILSTRP